MKRNTLLVSLTLIIGLFICCNHCVFAQCNLEAIIEKGKSSITPPFKYDSYWMSKFKFDTKPQKLVGHFVAFEGEKYQIILCSSGYAEVVTVNIFDKKSWKERALNKPVPTSDFRNELAKKYPQGVTEEIVKEGNTTTTRRIVVRGNKGVLYVMRRTNIGVFYFKDNTPIFESEFIQSTGTVFNAPKKPNNNSGTFEPTSSGEYYFEYTVPPGKNGKSDNENCVVLLIATIIEIGSN